MFYILHILIVCIAPFGWCDGARAPYVASALYLTAARCTEEKKTLDDFYDGNNQYFRQVTCEAVEISTLLRPAGVLPS